MNIQEYISSGIIESYVLGLADNEERTEFEKYCLQYPELVTARNKFEVILEQRLLDQGKAPGAKVRENVMNALRQQTPVKPTKIINMQEGNTNRASSTPRWVAAAAVILLLASSYFAYDFYTKNKELESRLAQTKTDQTKMQDRLHKLEMVDDPNVAVINLKGTEKAPKSSASIYWDSTSSNVYLVAKNMPKLASEKQYQLWALIDGKPKDLGLFDVGDDGKVILKMTNTEKADAFAITIEKRGNKGGPTMEQVQTLGKNSL